VSGAGPLLSRETPSRRPSDPPADIGLTAGTARVDITPHEPMFLYGYPHARRLSTGTHDPLFASALCLDDGEIRMLLVAVDVLLLGMETIARCREDIRGATGIPESNILISTTHTHSAPVTAEVLAFSDDPVVPPINQAYLERVHASIVRAAVEATSGGEPAEMAVTATVVTGVGSNRHSPDGPRDPEVGIVAVRTATTKRMVALDVTYAMHPTVLHEDSTLVSSDFPGYTRQYLEDRLPGIVTVYHTGPSGNQSPRYSVSGQTFDEARRLGDTLGEAIRCALDELPDAAFSGSVTLDAAQVYVQLPGRTFPPVSEAEALLAEARSVYQELVRTGAPHGPTRTAEVSVFGAEERVTLSRAQARGGIAALLDRVGLAPVQVFRLGSALLVGLPGELFVEYGLAIKQALNAKAYVISLANGELQGYIVTPDASGYEAGISLFTPEAGALLVEAALALANALLPRGTGDHVVQAPR